MVDVQNSHFWAQLYEFCCKPRRASRWQDAMSLLRAVLQLPLQPSLSLFNAAVSACAKGCLGHWPHAKQIYWSTNLSTQRVAAYDRTPIIRMTIAYTFSCLCLCIHLITVQTYVPVCVLISLIFFSIDIDRLSMCVCVIAHVYPGKILPWFNTFIQLVGSVATVALPGKRWQAAMLLLESLDGARHPGPDQWPLATRW